MTEGYDHLHTGSRCAVCAQRIGAEAKPAPVVLPEWVKAVLILTCVFSAVTFVRFVVELGDGLGGLEIGRPAFVHQREPLCTRGGFVHQSHRLVESGRSVLFTPAYRLVQDMLAAKRDLDLPRMLRKLDNIDFLLIDDLGYLPQGAEESEVLFTLIAERYERRSLGITSNLVFSQWEKVFANPMATAAAIDRIVHHSAILEFDVPSYRTGAAQQRLQQEVYRQE